MLIDYVVSAGGRVFVEGSCPRPAEVPLLSRVESLRGDPENPGEIGRTPPRPVQPAYIGFHHTQLAAAHPPKFLPQSTLRSAGRRTI